MFGIQANADGTNDQSSTNGPVQHPDDQTTNDNGHSGGLLNLPEPHELADPDDTNASLPSHSQDGTSEDKPAVAPSPDDLLEIKQQALHELSPLISHLDQTPEEKFKTTMMLMQATDNAGLVKAAYEAAQAVEDEKVRAQALLDVVNEINYFTQKEHDK